MAAKQSGFSKSPLQLFREERRLSRSELAALVSRGDPRFKREVAEVIALLEGGLESPGDVHIWQGLEHAGFPGVKAAQEKWYDEQKGGRR